MYKLLLTICLLGAALIHAQNKPVAPIHPVNTYSVICYDSASGQFGGAVQSHWFKVADVIWLKPGIGAVATQSLADFRYGKLGLDMMEAGKTSQEALVGIKTSDKNSAVRQVGMIDIHGNIATHTGDKCIAEAGDLTGEIDGIFFSVHANLMEKNTVWQAMKTAFENNKGDLADRMMAALEAAQTEGGDIRGMQSAAMFVVKGHPTGKEWEDYLIDIRVDDHAEPLEELKRILKVARAYEHMNKGDEYITAGEFDKASDEYNKASEYAPGNLEILYWHAVTLVTAGEIERSLPIFKKVFEQDDKWKTLTPRLVDSDLLPKDKAILDKIMGQ